MKEFIWRKRLYTIYIEALEYFLLESKSKLYSLLQ